MIVMASPGSTRDLFAPHFDERIGFDGARHFRGERFAIHRERMSAGNARVVRDARSAANPSRRSSSLSSHDADGC